MSQQRLTASPEKTQQRIAPRKTRPASAQSWQGGRHPILQLQQTLGNRRMAQLIQAKRLTSEGKIIGLQRKLTVGAADDPYEQEADRVARQVLHTSDAGAAHSMQRALSPEEDKDQMLQPKPLAASITPFMQRQMGHTEASEDQETPVQAKLFTEMSQAPLQRQLDTEEDETEPLQAKSAGALTESFEAGADVETQVSLSKGRGSPLPDPVRAYMEPRFGLDFSQVRVHTGSDAQQMNQAVSAQAFTHGSDIYFGAGHSPANFELTAHELTHVVQQTGEAPLQTKKQKQPIAPLALRHLSNGVVLRAPKASTPCPTCAANQEEMVQRQAYQEGAAPSERGKGPLNFLSTAGGAGQVIAPVVGGVHDLQQRAGNAAVSRLIRVQCACAGGLQPRQPLADQPAGSAHGASQIVARKPAAQRDTPGSQPVKVKFGPVSTGRTDEEVQRKQRAAREFIRRFPTVGRSFVDLAFSAAQNGARTAAKPPDPVAKENFDRALAGNLLWAATSLFATWNPAVIAMSFVGAAVGTGVGKQEEADFGLGDRLLADRLAHEADTFEASLMTDWDPVLAASMFVEQSSTPDDHEKQDRYMWRILLPSIPWESKRETITAVTRARASRAMADFLRQWLAWKAEIDECSRWRPAGQGSRDREIAVADPGRAPVRTVALSPIQRLPFIFPPVVGTSKMSKAECESANPFRPVLTFA